MPQLLPRTPLVVLFTLSVLFTNYAFVAAFSQTPYYVSDLNSTDSTAFSLDLQYWNASNLVNASSKSYNCNGTLLLGGYNVLGPSGSSTKNQYFSRVYRSFAAHNIIYFTLTLYSIDSFDANDAFQIWLDSANLTSWYQSYSVSSTSVCGSAWADLPPTRIFGDVQHSGSSVTLKFLMLNDEASTNESWGFRDIQLIFANSTTTKNNTMCGKSSINYTTVNCNCSEGQYKNSNGVCVACNSLCSSCYGPSAQECYQCAPSTMFNGTTCLVCDSSCLTCSGSSANQCTSCPSGKFLLNSQTCVDSSGCPLPLLPLYDSLGYGICKSPCNSTAFVFYNISCSSSCDATYHGSSIKLICLSSCPSPMTKSALQGINICSAPCSPPNKYYNTNKNTCQSSCTGPAVSDKVFYGLTCTTPPSTKDADTIKGISDASEAAGTAAQAGLAAINLATPFSSAAMVLGSLAKLLEYTKYLDITHSTRLELMFNTTSPSLSFINTDRLKMSTSLQNSLSVYPDPPKVFAKYNIPTSFLVNQWNTIVTFGLVFGIVCVIWFASWLISGLHSHPRLQLACKWIRLATQSYLFSQLYDGFGDVVLFSGIELQSVRLNSVPTGISFGCVIGALLACILTLGFHITFLRRYQTIRKADASNQIDHFKEQSESFKILFEDFFDLSLMQQFFLVFLSTRNIIYGVVLTSLYTQPLLQIIILSCLSIIALIYLALKRPFRRTTDMIQQVVFEVAILTANMCLSGMALMDLNSVEDSDAARTRLGDAFIMINTIVKFLPLLFIIPKLMNITVVLYHRVRNRHRKRLAIHNQTDNSESQSTQVMGLSLLPSHRRQGLDLVKTSSDIRTVNTSSIDLSDSARVNLHAGLAETFPVQTKLVTVHECEAGDVEKIEFYRQPRKKAAKLGEVKPSILSLNDIFYPKTPMGFGQQHSVHNNSPSKRPGESPHPKRFVRRVDADINFAEEKNSHQISLNNSPSVHGMKSLMSVYDPSPRVPKKRNASVTPIEIDMTPIHMSRSNIDMASGSQLFMQGDSLRQFEDLQSISQIEEVEDHEDDEEKKEEDLKVDRMMKNTRKLKKIVNG